VCRPDCVGLPSTAHSLPSLLATLDGASGGTVGDAATIYVFYENIIYKRHERMSPPVKLHDAGAAERTVT